MKKFLIIIYTIVLLLLLNGCGDGKPSGQDPGPAPQPAESDPERADYTVSFYRADSLGDESFGEFSVAQADNGWTMGISSVRHIPAIAIDNVTSLTGLIEAAKEYYQIDTAYDENESFADAIKKYDEAFFTENQLLILCLAETSGSVQYKVKDTPISGATLAVVIEPSISGVDTDDMADWFAIVELNKEEIKRCKNFDAYYD